MGTYLVESRVPEAVEAGDFAGGRGVSAAPYSDTIAFHLVRTLPYACRVRLLDGGMRRACFVSLGGGRWTHRGFAPGKAGKCFSDNVRNRIAVSSA